MNWILFMSSYCNYLSQYCSAKCCDYTGSCPSVTGNACYYYYPNTAVLTDFVLGTGAIAGIAVGAAAFLGLLIWLIVWCCRRKRIAEQSIPADGTVVVETTTHNIPIGQPPGPMGPGAMGQPVMGQPVNPQAYPGMPQTYGYSYGTTTTTYTRPVVLHDALFWWELGVSKTHNCLKSSPFIFNI